MPRRLKPVTLLHEDGRKITINEDRLKEDFEGGKEVVRQQVSELKVGIPQLPMAAEKTAA